ncbi:flagellar hook-basal body complex protein FliE [Candidatus Poribacteria bacterium]|nr:flagellar hook-basal body complex protein FliE [Candidatus Poribacteria bacterium]
MTTSDITLASRIASAQLQAAAPKGEGRPSDSEGASFAEVLAESIQKVNHLQKEADEAIQGLATGARPDVAQTMVAVQKASLSFQLMAQVRNKLVQAYEEVMRTPM